MNTSIQSVQGGTRLAFDSVEGITNTVERMHETIVRRALPWSQLIYGTDRAHGLTASAVYAAIRGINGALRTGIDRSFDLVPDTITKSGRSGTEGRMVSALNGVFGDHLEATGNALAIPMRLTTPHHPLDLDRAAVAAAIPQASPHIVVLVHGLSLSEHSWQRKEAPCMGSRLQQELGHTPLYLSYNSGRHISTNGQEFAQQLEQLCEAWPVPVESLSLIGHSMGGLVIRSACWYAEQAKSDWLPHLQRVVCLGTPHHGSPLERAGHALDVAIQKIPYTEPLALTRQRSAGIKDLRHGNLLDEDWLGHNPDQPRPDNRRTVPFLPDVDYYFAAATLGRHDQDPLGHLLGDFLVRMDSAVGSHKDDLRHLPIKPENCQVFHEKNHFDLINDERVHQQIIAWFEAG
jgi:pimeloyl-ACP methyl ester carboxylesterase